MSGQERLHPAPDPRPQPPREPTLEECCKGGCEPCVFDRYYAALERYREALSAWLERHPGETAETAAGGARD